MICKRFRVKKCHRAGARAYFKWQRSSFIKCTSFSMRIDKRWRFAYCLITNTQQLDQITFIHDTYCILIHIVYFIYGRKWWWKIKRYYRIEYSEHSTSHWCCYARTACARVCVRVRTVMIDFWFVYETNERIWCVKKRVERKRVPSDKNLAKFTLRNI